MHRYKVMSIIVLALVVLPVMQNQLHSAAYGQDTQRPAQVMLSWGATALPYPDWVVKIEEDKHEAVSTWKQPGAVIRYRQLFDFGTYTVDKLKAVLNEKWFKSTMQEYGPWEKLGQCVVGNYLVFDMKAQSKTDKALVYRVRYWVWSDAQAFTEVLAAFDDKQADDLEPIADKLFGEAARCGAADATKSATMAATTAPS